MSGRKPRGLGLSGPEQLKPRRPRPDDPDSPREGLTPGQRFAASPGAGHRPTACCLCGEPCERWGPGEGQWGNNPQPLADPPARCCNRCNSTRVVPARLGMAPGEGLGRAWEDAEAQALTPDPVAARHQQPVSVSVGKVGPSDLGLKDALARTSPSVAAQIVAGAPVMRTAVDVAELRAWMVRQWQPGGVFSRAAALARDLGVPWSFSETELGHHRAGLVADDATTERRALQRASLFYVEAPMVDLIAQVAQGIPPDVKPTDLTLPSVEGFAVFAKPLVGVTIQGSPVEVWAITWQPATIHGPNGERLPSLTISSYRRIDFDEGLDAETLNDPAALAQLAQATDRLTSTPGATGAAVHGQAWLPLGRSDWPLNDAASTVPFWAQGNDALWASYEDDRRAITAMFLLLAEDGVSSRVIERPGRPVTRRAQRSGVTAPSDISVITLRRPRFVVPEGTPEHEHDEHAPPPRNHRWLVREHPRWQAVGKGRQERRLTMVRAHIKGPEGAPLVIKTKVFRWVR